MYILIWYIHVHVYLMYLMCAADISSNGDSSKFWQRLSALSCCNVCMCVYMYIGIMIYVWCVYTCTFSVTLNCLFNFYSSIHLWNDASINSFIHSSIHTLHTHSSIHPSIHLKSKVKSNHCLIPVILDSVHENLS